jgi:drug/metabolite transporter (DMT)-like permease
LTGFRALDVTFKFVFGGYAVTLLSYAAIYLIWGSTFLAIRLAIDSIPPLLMMGVRCVTAGALLLVWAAVRGQRVEWRSWGHAAVAGALMFGCAYAAIAWAEQRLASGVTALFVATLPLWLTVFEWAGRRTTPPLRAIAGLAIGFGGVVLLVIRDTNGAIAIVPAGVVVLGEMAWAAGSLYARPPRLPRTLALNAGMPLVCGGALLIAASFIAREFNRVDLHAVTALSAAALLYLIVFGSIVAFSAYAWLMQRAPASRVATHAYVNPLIAVVLGSAIAREPFTITIAISSLVIAGGVALVLAAPASPRRRRARPAERAAA